MLFAPPDLGNDEREAIARITTRRAALAQHLRVPRRWEGNLRRHLMARAIQGSNSIEGYVVETDDAAAAIDHDEPMSASDQTFAEIRGYRQALGYALTLAAAGQTVDSSALRAAHFMMLSHDLSKSPGQYRRGPIYVNDEQTGEIVYEGAPSEQVGALVDDLMGSLSATGEPLVDAAMAHLNLVMIHPFRDGNGRMSRALQTLVLGHGGIGEPTFSSIEEWLGAHTLDYSRVLTHTGRGRWSPTGDTSLWIRFNLRAHDLQSQLVERRLRRTEEIWARLDDLTASEGLPARVADALYDALLGYRLRRPRYVELTGLDQRTATRDLGSLSDHDLLRAQGATRGRHYVAGPRLIALRDSVRRDVAYEIEDPWPSMPAQLAEPVD